MNLESTNLSNIFVASKLNQPLSLTSKTSRSFAAILRNSIKESSLETGSSSGTGSQLSSDAIADKIGQPASEGENKYCSMCGSRIKEDGTCPVCIVPIFISGNPGSHSQGASQVNSARSIVGSRVTFSYNHRMR